MPNFKTKVIISFLTLTSLAGGSLYFTSYYLNDTPPTENLPNQPHIGEENFLPRPTNNTVANFEKIQQGCT
jgi:hypothetical protein